MIVLGVDPGTRHLGWGVLRVLGTRVEHVAHGVIHTREEATLSARLVTLDDAFRAMLAIHAPEEAGVEAIFFAKDATSASKLGHARGVILLALERAGVRVHEYPPALVKRAVAGGGRAEKAQVARVVRAVLRLTTEPAADAADALAIALAHVQSAPARRIAALAVGR